MTIDSFRGEYRWLSNFHLVDIEFEGDLYTSTEAAYQAAKTFDPEEREEIRQAPTPGKARRLGQKVTMRADWDDVKLDIMRDLLRQKFKDPQLRERLVLTARQHLIEGNSWGDEFYGVCQGNGLNHLGRILMDVRAEVMKRQC
jgi:ribA/ribD-fused uncharacterized protein